MLLGHAVRMGLWLSITGMVKLHALVLPLPSVAVQVTVLVPLGKVEPLAGLQTTERAMQLSLAPGTGQVATAVQAPGAVFKVRLIGQVMVGFSVSFTVTMKLQVLW